MTRGIEVVVVGLRRTMTDITALLFILAVAWHCRTVIATYSEELNIDGDILLGGLFPVHRRGKTAENQCDQIDPQPGYQYLIAMLFALNEINNNSNILPNITLGAKIYDTCRSQTIAVDRAKDFIKYTLLDKSEITSPLAGVIGAFRSDVSLAVANLLRVFDIPQVSFGSTTVELSDKSIYGNFLRTVPPNSFQSKAMVDVVGHFNWKYIMTVYSPGDYGEKGMEGFYAEAEKAGICIANKIKLPAFPSEEDYKRVVHKLLATRTKRSDSLVGVVVLFCIQRDNRGLVRAASQRFNGTERITWLASNSWGNRVDVTNGHEKGGEGAITIDFVGGEVENFRNYFLKLKPQVMNHTQYPWFEEFWQQKLNCRLKNAAKPLNVSKECSENEVLPRNLEIVPVRVVINAVFAVAYALDNMYRSICPNGHGLCPHMREMKGKLLLEFLKNVTFPDAAMKEPVHFNRNGEVNGHYNVLNFTRTRGGSYQHVIIGSWRGVLANDDTVTGNLSMFKKKQNYLGMGAAVTPVSYCSKPCNFDQVQIRDDINPKCCWRCINCKRNEIILNGTCDACPAGYKPDKNLLRCAQLPLRYPTWGEVPASIITTLAFFGILGTICTAVFFIIFREHAVIKAAGKELSSIMFVGVLLCYIAALLWLVKPSRSSCGARRFIGSISLTTCYAPILLRTVRIYRIFTAARKTVRRPSFVSPKAQIVAASCIIGVQIFIAGVWFLARPPGEQSVYTHDEYVLLECHAFGSHVTVYLAYNLILLLTITVLAFKTRTYPRNFNEAKYIGVSAYLSCSVWIIIFPSYLNTEDSFVQAYLASTALLLVATIILGGLLVSKIFLVRSKDSSAAGSVTVPSVSGLEKSRSEDYVSNSMTFTRARIGVNQSSQCDLAV